MYRILFWGYKLLLKKIYDGVMIIKWKVFFSVLLFVSRFCYKMLKTSYSTSYSFIFQIYRVFSHFWQKLYRKIGFFFMKIQGKFKVNLAKNIWPPSHPFYQQMKKKPASLNSSLLKMSEKIQNLSFSKDWTLQEYDNSFNTLLLI